MRANLVQIGNSRGVRIPKTVLDQIGLHDEIELEVRGSQLVIRAASHARAGWDEAFSAMAARGDDQWIATPASKWDESEWKW